MRTSARCAEISNQNSILTTAIISTRLLTRSSVAAAVQEQCRASIQRSLHPTQSSNLTGSSPSSAATSPRKRKSGNPRSFSTPVAPLASLADFDPAPIVSSVKLTVGILPKVLNISDHNNTLDLSPRYFWKSGGDIEKVQTALQRANLVFTVDIDVTGPTFDKVDIAFQNHCQANKIDYVATAHPAAVITPNTTLWGLLGPNGR
ncbi:hypothetical protein B0H13DRAFT_2366117 [Mycena leptocephala]|nr:hypothetical protein B0H13DRAFT_2366117 [Mycena leptocephala]